MAGVIVRRGSAEEKLVRFGYINLTEWWTVRFWGEGGENPRS